MTEFPSELPVLFRHEVPKDYQLQNSGSLSCWMISLKTASICFGLLCFSGVPALLLLEAYRCLQIGAALGIGSLSENDLFLLFYIYTVGGNLPIIGWMYWLGTAFTEYSTLRVSERGISRIISGLKGLYGDFFLMKVLGKLPAYRPLAWKKIDSVRFLDGFRGSSGFPERRLVFRLADGSRLEQILNGLSLGDQVQLLEDLKRHITVEYSEPVVAPSLNSLPGLIEKLTVAGLLRNLSGRQVHLNRRVMDDLLSAGSHLKNGAYIVEKILPAGGFANVYLASRVSGEAIEKVVLKEFILPAKAHNLASDSRGSTMLDEIALLKCLSHPSIVNYLDDFIEDQRAYLVTGYFESANLLDLVKERGPLPLEEVIEISIQLCKVLKYLHSMRPPVIHRDLTPHNILVSATGEVKVIDFNAALHKFRKPGSKDEVIGKPKYLPPEQFRGLAVRQSDIYALGCDMFYMLTGVEPLAITQSHPLLFVSVPSFFEQIVARATALDFKERYGDGDALLADLLALKLELESTS